MIGTMPVLDAVVHPFNFSEENSQSRDGQFLSRMIETGHRNNSPEAYRIPEGAFLRDWGIDEIANAAFIESGTDLAVYHVLPLNAFSDGACSLDKALEARSRWPNRFLFYIGVDPTSGAAALDEMQRQYDLLEGDVVGLKLYPNSWLGERVRGWLMNDPQVAFPVFEKALELKLRTVAIHKAFPLGPVEMLHYRMDDIDLAAMTFPSLNFEVVHGGVAFVEETAWQLRRFENVFVNLETTTMLALNRPLAFEAVMANFMRNPEMTKRILWATGGCMVGHPRMLLDAFNRFQFSDTLVDKGSIAPITDADKRAILSENYARMAGLDLAQRLRAIENDEFDQRRRELKGAPAPYSTTRAPNIARGAV
jgi:predicted TIM-barrel fold metal-dependent hydrolase